LQQRLLRIVPTKKIAPQANQVQYVGLDHRSQRHFLTGERVERRLAAVLAADVAGYSRLMGRNEEGTLADLKRCRQTLFDPQIATHRGRIVKTTGDGMLVEFASAVEAVNCAGEVQRSMAAQNADVPHDLRIEFRIGVHVGDIIIDDDDIFGDGVNIAARLEGIAEPGGICISRQVYDQIEGKLPLICRPLGPQNLKNISKPVAAYAIDFDGAPAGPIEPDNMKLQVNYCRASDGVRLAYATVGRGPQLVKTANWMNHVEYDWESSVFRHLYVSLARDFTLLRYDARGNGLSDWDVKDVSLDAWVSDLETVVDAAGLDRFPLLGISQGCAISVAFAVRHPERVSHLVLYGGFARGAYRRARNELELQQAKALATLIRTGWGSQSPVYRQLFSSLFMPGGTPEQLQKFAERQRTTSSAECAYRYYETTRNLDVTELLAKVSVPTLVMHKRDDQVQPFEGGRELAAGIPGARFVALSGQNHFPLEQDPETERILEEIRLFLKGR
jgi:class 3 adenylate cyclase/pimeloyl-ACP methyl ester carboxylesterase